jgi:hypothetical protein
MLTSQQCLGCVHMSAYQARDDDATFQVHNLLGWVQFGQGISLVDRCY